MGSDTGVLLAEGKSSGAANVKQQIICGALAMDSDISQVRNLHVSESRSYFLVGAEIKSQGDRKCCKHLLHGKASWYGNVSEKLLSLEAVLVSILLLTKTILGEMWEGICRQFLQVLSGGARPSL